jgi:hypothetical protein
MQAAHDAEFMAAHLRSEAEARLIWSDGIASLLPLPALLALVQSKGPRALVAAAPAGDAMRNTLRAMCSSVVAEMAERAADADVQVKGLLFLHLLTVQRGFFADVNAVVQCALKAMCTHAAHARVQLLGCATIGAFGGTSNCRPSAADSMAAVLSAMQSHSTDVDVTQSALTALTQLLAAYVAGDAACSTAVLSAMQAHTASASVQLTAMEALAELQVGPVHTRFDAAAHA